MGFNITVHDFITVSASHSRTSFLSEQGHLLVHACASSNQWVTPQSAVDSSAFALRCDRLYQYRSSPPSSSAPTIRPTGIPEWGQPSHADDPDHLRLQDLQEFDSTDFQTSLMHPRMREGGPSRRGKRVQGDDASVNELVKRPRFETSSILNLIPQPHFIPAPAANFRPVDTRKIPHYHKTSPVPIAPYDAAAVDLLLNCKYRRTAWLIPVRGSLPWVGASSAALAEESQVAPRSPSPCPNVPSTQSHTITWTASSIQHFWTFLASLQQAKHLGPLSLSFHAAPADAFSARDSNSELVWESNNPYYHQPSSKQNTAFSDDFAMDICGSHLEGTDHIKIFHDVPYSLSLRNILDAYRYESVSGEVPGRSSANDRKIRILKGAHLALMDEHSKAAFLM